ncbi:MAG: chemotaxis protein CheW [Hydrogenovibrio sp.]|uniref:chemotaxis protein CheV n=1 Tax=Hydrogenovibrio sp. TaxID=2065821 RepID=UPI0028701494|nr:chemotaxis protein CheW [Hydrogenovibrio sp.]MDR9499510.1 chemotaxis protein CheW [Hydrogenovibrio sp.]
MDLERIDKTASLSKNNSMSLMIFKLVNEYESDFEKHPFYSMNIFKIKEVLSTEDYSIKMATMNDSEFFKGVISVRGEFISIYDAAQWFGQGELKITERSVIVIAEVNHQTIGLLLAYIHGVAEKDWKELQSVERNAQKIVSQTRIEDELCLVMDIEQMIAEISDTDLEKEAQVEALSGPINKKILFADDQGSIRGYVKAVLENLGIDHEIYKDGQGIIDYLSEQDRIDQVGMVITDLEMPNVSGHTVIRTIKENMDIDIPVIVHSSMTVGESVRQASELGADGFIGKIDTKEIVATIKKYFKN